MKCYFAERWLGLIQGYVLQRALVLSIICLYHLCRIIIIQHAGRNSKKTVFVQLSLSSPHSISH